MPDFTALAKLVTKARPEALLPPEFLNQRRDPGSPS
jgi:hypothetical protein